MKKLHKDEKLITFLQSRYPDFSEYELAEMYERYMEIARFYASMFLEEDT